MQASTSSMETSFTGVLVRRQYKPGQHYVQLVFKSAKDTRVSISQNIRLIKSLSIGKTYRVVGPEFVVGHKRFIREPRAFQLPDQKKSHKLWLLLPASALAATLLLVGGLFTVRSLAHNNATSTGNTSQQGHVESANTGSTLNPAVTSTPTPPNTTTNGTGATTNKTKTSSNTSNQPTTSSTPADSGLPSEKPYLPPACDPTVTTCTPPACDPTVTTCTPPACDPTVTTCTPPACDPTVTTCPPDGGAGTPNP